ncbi:MAG: hypothetical protein A2Z99_16245 [Treponema sp. GWB1_62_6]|nr:MAG: hypothetical protein A2Y36_06570 [Treponema sp. GWA1_62_8]OHE65345.1 MAG: hypothetical protein A2001_05130 [Treponema sp. GWC1_61_84]OHE65352.1 MAG: hypothetical protein A2Z99_16245 [Treponema sp. GWB1_62_6]OHE74789.1 MAG: hypothetical protein A2413_12155 [Treponema sp. RIFOXYC1_FULL_61_9]HCM26668.1 hypothetical protein [Treponema sp.]
MKKNIVAFVFAATALAVIGCASAPEKKPDAKGKTVPKYEVLDHKTMALGQDIPEWVTVYVTDGNSGVESLDRYKEKFVFVGEQSGTNKNALQLWVTGFNVAQDMSRLMSTRVQAKFAGAAAGSPEAEFGSYFENVVKNVSDATFSGARIDSNFWILKRYFKDDNKTVDREVYDYYVLVTIDRALLQKQLDNIINGVKLDKPVTKEQQTAVDRVKESFYEGF